jgi:SNF2 family DNA or RNA helicase
MKLEGPAISPWEVNQGDRITFNVADWLAKDRKLASRELSGVVLRATDKALFVRAHCTVRESQYCLRCHQEIDNPISRLVGFGPVCSDHLGIPRPEALKPELIDAIRERVARETVAEMWLPRRHLTILERVAASPHSSPEPELPPAPASAPQRLIEHDGTGFILKTPYDPDLVNYIRAKLKPLGARWTGSVWRIPTGCSDVLRDFAQRWQCTISSDAEKVIEGALAELAASSSVSSDLEVAGLGGVLRPFQRAGVAYAAERRRVILGDEMGLGKTIVALATLQHLSAYPAVVVCPASLKLNWQREAGLWLPDKRAVVINKRDPGNLEDADITIVNYDLLPSLWSRLAAISPKALVIDESHYVKTPAAKRTIAVRLLAEAIRAQHGEQAVVLALTGTAVLNNPLELASQLNILGRLAEFGGWNGFNQRYSNATRKTLIALNRDLRSRCYIRREKADVLRELPPKQRAFIPVTLSNYAEYRRAELDYIQYLKQKALEDAAFKQSLEGLSPQERRARVAEHAAQAVNTALRAEMLVKLNGLRQLVGRGKLEAAFDWIDTFMQTGQKLVVFAWHTDVIASIAKRYDAWTITGDTPVEQRQRAVNDFQNPDGGKQIIVCNLTAGGVGITLHAASNILFVEYGWTPAIHDQAEDRCHRIGQQDSVNAWYLVAENSIDQRMMHFIERKRGIVEAVLTGEEGQIDQTTVMREIIHDLAER